MSPSHKQSRTLVLLALLYAVASLIHFAHNAIFLPDYPNMPAWLTAAGVWAAWLGVTAVGAIGLYVHARISRVAGLVILGVYGLLGFAGLDHYAVAPVSAHSLMMNSSIVSEVATAAAFLAFVGHSLRPGTRRTSHRVGRI